MKAFSSLGVRSPCLHVYLKWETMGISGNMQSLSQLCACYGVPRVTQGFTTLFIGETFAVQASHPLIISWIFFVPYFVYQYCRKLSVSFPICQFKLNPDYSIGSKTEAISTMRIWQVAANSWQVPRPLVISGIFCRALFCLLILQKASRFYSNLSI